MCTGYFNGMHRKSFIIVNSFKGNFDWMLGHKGHYFHSSKQTKKLSNCMLIA